MKLSIGKIAPGDYSRNGIGADKAARHEPRTNDRRDQEQNNIRASVETSLEADTPQDSDGTGIAGHNHGRSQEYRHRRRRHRWKHGARQQFPRHYQWG